MSFTCDPPTFFCYMRAEFAYDGREHVGEFFDVQIVAMDSVYGRAPGFVALTSFGALFDRLPIHALCHRKDAPAWPLDQCCLWDCLSYKMEARCWENLSEVRTRARLKDGEWYDGKYKFTLSWWDTPLADDPGDGGFKRGHFMELDNGNYAIQPGNRISWHEPSFVTQSFPERPDFITNSHVWKCEDDRKWRTEDSDRLFYEGVEENK